LFKEQLFYIQQKIKFVEAVLNDKIKIRSSKSEILQQTNNEGFTLQLTEEFLKMSIISFSKEKVQAMKKQRNDFEVQLNITLQMTAEQMYQHDLQQLMGSKKRKRE